MQGDKITLQFLSVRVDWLTWQHADRSLSRHHSVHRVACYYTAWVAKGRNSYDYYHVPVCILCVVPRFLGARLKVLGILSAEYLLPLNILNFNVYIKGCEKYLALSILILSIKGKRLHAWNEWRCDLKNWYYTYILYLLYNINIFFLHMMKKKREKEWEYMYKCIVFKNSSNSSR